MSPRFHPDLAALLLTAAACAAVAVLIGCEVDTASSSGGGNSLRVSPASVELAEGQSQEFTVAGGYETVWSLANEAWGLLVPRTGNRAVYTSRYTPDGGNEVQTIIVTSFIEGSGGGTNNAGTYQATGEAIVIHRGSDPSATPVATTTTSTTTTTGSSTTTSTDGPPELPEV